MSRGSNGSSILGPSDSRRRGGHSGRRSRSAREGGNRRREGGIPRIGREHGITLAARKGTAPPTTATSAITSAATAGATTSATATREGDGHCYLLDTEEAMPRRRSVLPPLSSPPHNSSHRGISMKSPNLQPKKIFALWKGFPPIWGQNPFKKGENFNCSVICSTRLHSLARGLEEQSTYGVNFVLLIKK